MFFFGKRTILFVFFCCFRYEASRDCDLVISGETFGRSGYGIALSKNSFWTERVTLQLLRLIESGFMETLDNRWILRTEKQCDKHLESFPTTLGLENMAGVFMLVGAGKRAEIVFEKNNKFLYIIFFKKI